MSQIRLVVADDHVMMRQGIVQMLTGQGNMTVLAECNDGIELIAAVLKHQPDVVLMDISMPRMSGLVAIDKMLTQRPDTRVIALTMHDELEYVDALRQAGAYGYMLKESSAEQLINAIIKVAQGKTCFIDTQGKSKGEGDLRQGNPLTGLTRREREVFFMVVAGHTSKEIGDLLNMSLKTAENHRGKILKKLGVANTPELIRLAGKAGLLE